MSGHTPGPWEARPDWGAPYGVPIYSTVRNDRDEREHVGNAYRGEDARLIAAAPGLLEALKGLLEVADAYSDEMRGLGRGSMELGSDAPSMSASGVARTAIARATGGEP